MDIKEKITKAFSGRYIVTGSIGAGGTGTVFMAETTGRVGIQRAIKAVDKKSMPGEVDLFAEAEALKDLDHPCIPAVIEVAEDDRYVYIVQELVRGRSLKQIVEEYGPVNEDSVLEWMKEISDALSYIHSRGIVHRDIKPSNIMLTKEGRIKLIDFGLAKSTEVIDVADNRVIGTRNYTPPERYKGLPADEKTDLYEFGTTFYYIVTGKAPLPMSEHQKQHMMIMKNELSAVKSGEIRSVITGCINIDPNKREIVWRDEQEEVSSGKEIERKPNSGVKWVAVAALAVVILAGGVFGIIKFRDSQYNGKINKARAYFDADDFKASGNEYLSAVNLNKNRSDGYQGVYEVKTELASDEEDFDEIVNGIGGVFKEHEDFVKKSSGLNYLLGNAYYEQGKYKKSIEPLKRAASISGGTKEAVLLAMTYYELGEYDEADSVIEKLKESGKDSYQANYLSAESARMQGDIISAAGIFEELAWSKADVSLRRKAVTECARMYIDNDQNSDAIYILSQAEEDDDLKGSYKIKMMLADRYFADENYLDAAGKYVGCLEISESSKTYNNLAIAYLFSDQYDEAIEITEKMAKKYPEDYRANALHAIVLSYIHEEDWEEMDFSSYDDFMRQYELAKEKAQKSNRENEETMMVLEETYEMVTSMKARSDALDRE